MVMMDTLLSRCEGDHCEFVTILQYRQVLQIVLLP